MLNITYFSNQQFSIVLISLFVDTFSLGVKEKNYLYELNIALHYCDEIHAKFYDISHCMQLEF